MGWFTKFVALAFAAVVAAVAHNMSLVNAADGHPKPPPRIVLVDAQLS